MLKAPIQRGRAAQVAELFAWTRAHKSIARSRPQVAECRFASARLEVARRALVERRITGTSHLSDVEFETAWNAWAEADQALRNWVAIIPPAPSALEDMVYIRLSTGPTPVCSPTGFVAPLTSGARQRLVDLQAFMVVVRDQEAALALAIAAARRALLEARPSASALSRRMGAIEQHADALMAIAKRSQEERVRRAAAIREHERALAEPRDKPRYVVNQDLSVDHAGTRPQPPDYRPQFDDVQGDYWGGQGDLGIRDPGTPEPD